MSATPLAGLLVVDLSRNLPGPLAARLLADLGARVLKVEEPELGDPVRQAPPTVGGRGALAELLLGGVESLALDLKQPAARAALDRLLAAADVALSTFRPGTLERLGLDGAALRRRHPRLIACNLSGWGAGGPWAGRAGHDLTYQAVAGTLAPSGAMPAAPLADLLGGWSAVAAILAALVGRAASGEGAVIDASLYDAAVHANLVAWAEEAGAPRAVGEPLGLTGALPCYNLYRARDGRLVALAALERRFWRRFCAAAGCRRLAGLQYRRDPESRARVAAVFAGRDGEEWAALFAREDLPAAVVASAAEARAHPQARARALLATAAGSLPRLSFPALFDGARPGRDAPAPQLGQDTTRVLAEFGAPEAALPARRRRVLGIGRRRSWRRFLWRLVSASS